MDKGYPLILVFYLNNEMMRNKDIIVPFTESVNNAIAIREANAMAFFLPTEGEERIECINPLTVPEEKIEEVNKIIEDLKKNFDIGQGADENLEEND
jgi:hypothetical protein